MEKKSLWQCYNSEEFEQLEQVNALYRERLDEGKTERECARKNIALAKQKGYSDLKEFVNQKKPLKAAREFGADDGVRTRDPNLGKVVLYQLSHVRIARKYITRTEIPMQGLS